MQNDQLIVNKSRLDNFSERLLEERRKVNRLCDILSDCRRQDDPSNYGRYSRLIGKAEQMSRLLQSFSDGVMIIGEDSARASRQISDMLEEINYESSKANYFDFGL